MRILIDFTQIPIKKVGVGVYALNTFSEMFKANPNNEFYAISQDDDNELLFQSDNVKNIRINSKIFRSLFMRSIIEQFYIPFISKRYKIDLIHSLHYSFPLIKTKAKKVITIHDLTFFIYPKLHQFVKRYYFKWFIKKAAKNKNNTLICVSKSTLTDLQKFIPDFQSSNHVVPLACDFKDLCNCEDIKQKFGITRPYITFIGTLEPRKNIEGLIKAYSMLREKEKYHLVIVGKKGWYYDTIFKLVEELSLSKDIIFTGFVTEEDKYSILQQSSVFVYPSFYEGFGLPVLEAITLGIPTVTSNISSLPEVGGAAALYANPKDIQNLSDNIGRALYDEDLRKQMIFEGHKHARQFSWSLTSDKTFKIYQKCLNTNK